MGSRLNSPSHVVAIEAVGVPATFGLAAQLARPGGHIANIGVHGEPATLHLEELWIRNVTITTGLVDTYSTPTLLRLAQGELVDPGGKGGTIRRITERTSPRVFKHIALPVPTEREKSQMYVQRYVTHFPAAGEVVIFDRSWYNRAGVEPVLGYCTREQTERFLGLVPTVEKAMVDSGIILIKYWLNVSVEEQARRLENRIDDPRKTWKLSATDLKSYSLRYDYCRARDAMLAATDTSWAPWFVVNNDGKKRGRLNVISHLLGRIPYEPVPRRDVKLPEQPSANGYVEPDLPLHLVPEKY